MPPSQVDGVEVDSRRAREGARLLLQQTTGHRVDLPGTREREQPRPQQGHRHSLRNRGTSPDQKHIYNSFNNLLRYLRRPT